MPELIRTGTGEMRSVRSRNHDQDHRGDQSPKIVFVFPILIRSNSALTISRLWHTPFFPTKIDLDGVFLYRHARSPRASVRIKF